VTTLRTVLDTYGHTEAIKTGTVASPRIDFDFVEVKPIHSAFAPMANEQSYDVGEIAIVTFLQAFAAGKPIVLLPAAILHRFHHRSIVKKAGGPIAKPADLNGKRIGVRSYTQTTGVWVRGILHAEYGVDLDSVTNVTTEGGHIKEYVEPPNVVRAPAGSPDFKEMLLSGEIDAWISGPGPQGPDIVPLVDGGDAAETAWFERLHAFPINHMIAMKTSLLDADPSIAEDVFGLLAASKAAYLDRLKSATPQAPDEVFRAKLLARGEDPLPFGIAALRTSLETIIAYAVAQHLIPRAYAVEELFDPRVLRLGS
jgi:4,5-dihydroxyphthalate decarboxylase